MKLSEKYPNLKYILKSFIVPFLFLLTLFVFIAYLVVAIRVSEVKSYIMPDVTGKYFINIYEDLSKYNLNIKIKRIYIKEKPEGLILQQSIFPGEFIKPKDNLTLIVNSYQPILTIPKLVDLTLINAKEILSSISYDGEVYSLEISKILYVYRDDKPPDTVLYQYPKEDTKVPINQKVILIVSTNQPMEIKIEELSGVDFGSLSYYLANNNLNYILKEVIPAKSIKEHGIVTNIKFNKNKYEITASLLKNKDYRFYSDFEKVKFKFKKESKCEIFVSNVETENIEKILIFDKIWISHPNKFDEQKLELIVNTVGNTYVYLVCDNKLMKVKSFEPDFKI